MPGETAPRRIDDHRPGDDPMTTPQSAGAPSADRRPYVMLGMAAAGFALTFWAWALLSPLGAHFKQALGLTSFQQALLVAVPVIVGALGRTPFAVGVPFVNAWFPAERRGLAIGVFGMGMGGTAISALTTVKLTAHWGIHAPFLIVAGALAVYGVAAALVLRDAPGRPVPSQPALSRLAATLRLQITWQAAALYAVGFGGFVAFSVYLPVYLKNAYLLTPADAADKMAGFVLLAVLLRPVGGWLSDRVAPSRVLTGAFAVVAAAAIVQSLTPVLAPIGTVAFLVMAAALGAAAGAVFALVAQRAPAQQVGAVTGVVGAAGGLGGFVPPLLMGSIYGANGSYAWGLLALAAVAACAMTYSLSTPSQPVRTRAA